VCVAVCVLQCVCCSVCVAVCVLQCVCCSVCHSLCGSVLGGGDSLTRIVSWDCESEDWEFPLIYIYNSFH